MRRHARPDQPPPHYHYDPPAEVFVLLAFLSPNSVIVDAGGRNGVYSATDQGRPSLVGTHWRALCQYSMSDRGMDRQ